MARLLIRALEGLKHRVDVISQLRTFSRVPDERPDLKSEAEAERQRIEGLWNSDGKPDLWFCYHPYYKAPDLLGPDLCRRHGIPYITAEASWSRRRNDQGWAMDQALVLASITDAAANICMTRRDRDGLKEAAPQAVLELLPPFIDCEPYRAISPTPVAGRLITVAMMRPGDKLDSYHALAASLALVKDPWHLTIIGDGPCRGEVEALFAPHPPASVSFLGECGPERVARELAHASIYAWPGCGEAYGLAYLEAQAAGLPVVAFETAGVPEVVVNGKTGLLTAAGDSEAFARAITRLLRQESERLLLGSEARRFVLEERSLVAASRRLAEILHIAMGNRHDT